MKRSALIAAILLAVLAIFVFIGAQVVGEQALIIDNFAWRGYPVAPCFVDAIHCGRHLLGTDENGRDILARLIVGGSVTLATALLSLFIALAVGFGLTALTRRGGRVIRYIVGGFAEGVNALPRLPLALLITFVAFNAMSDGTAPNTLELASWYGLMLAPAAFCSFQTSPQRIVIVRRAILILMTIVLLSSTVDFFGFGQQPPIPSWGNMMANVQEYVAVGWWISVFPTTSIFVTVFLLDIVRRGLQTTPSALLEPVATAATANV